MIPVRICFDSACLLPFSRDSPLLVSIDRNVSSMVSLWHALARLANQRCFLLVFIWCFPWILPSALLFFPPLAWMATRRVPISPGAESFFVLFFYMLA